MRNRSTARLWPGSFSGSLPGLALLALSLARPAAADQAAPPPPAAPAADQPAPPSPAAPAIAPPSPPAAPAAEAPGHHLALLDVPPTPEERAAAAVLVPAARDAIQTDGRFTFATVAQVAAARAEHGVSDTDLTYPDACRVGRALGASHAILLGGYDLTLHTSEKKSDLKRAMGMVSEIDRGHGKAKVSSTASLPDFEARATASVIVMDMAGCNVGEQAVIQARHESAVSMDDARIKVQADFVEAVRRGLQRIFPLHAFVRAPAANGGVISHGSRHGVRAGQYYTVHRGGRAVGDVHVDQVAPDSAQVSLVRGVHGLQAGDSLAERDTLRVWEFGLAATPTLLARRQADDSFGMAVSVNGAVSQPVSGNVYGLMVEYLVANELARWRAGVHYGRQLQVVPRRLFVHAHVGVGAFIANQPLVDQTGQMYDGGTARGLELLNGLGVKALLGESWAVQAELKHPLPLRDDFWTRDSNSKHRVPADELIYTRAQRRLPALTVGMNMRF